MGLYYTDKQNETIQGKIAVILERNTAHLKTYVGKTQFY